MLEAFFMLMAGIGAGAVAMWLFMRGERTMAAERLLARERLAEGLDREVKESRVRLENLAQEATRLRVLEAELKTRLVEERKTAEAKLAAFEDAGQTLANAFKALSDDALKSNNQAFLQLARETLDKYQIGAKSELDMRQAAVAELVKPISDSLEKVDRELRLLEKDRKEAYGGLNMQVRQMAEVQLRLQAETASLVSALRAPKTRGCWGEIQLQRVVEMAGMVEYCDFVQQPSASTEDGVLRPDMIISLPSGRRVVVDAKVSLQAYLDALEAPSDLSRTEKLAEHARQIRSHIVALGAKAYWAQFQPAPEFVVMFVPGEAFFSAALEQDPGLIEYGVAERVILATPTTLIALLKAVAYGWKQETLTKNAQAISALGKELYTRLGSLAEHFEDLRRGLERAVDSYNRAAGSLEARVFVTARKFRELTVAHDEEIPLLDAIDRAPRPLQAPEAERPQATAAVNKA